jgi:hypothetical protein
MCGGIVGRVNPKPRVVMLASVPTNLSSSAIEVIVEVSRSNTSSREGSQKTPLGRFFLFSFISGSGLEGFTGMTA